MAYTIHDLGVMSAEGASLANAVSTDGTVIVGFGTAPDGVNSSAFRWTAGGGMVDLGFMGGGVYTQALACSSNGTVLVGEGDTSTSGGLNRAFRWTSGGGFQNLGTLPSGVVSSAACCSADGATVFGYSNVDADSLSPVHLFSWTAGGGMVDHGIPVGAAYAIATACSADGSVVVGQSDNQAWYWTAGGGFVSLTDVGGYASANGNACSSTGAVLTGTSLGNAAWIWDAGGGIRLLGGFGTSWAYGASADGTTIVGQRDFLSTGPAFIWTAGAGMVDLSRLAVGATAVAKAITANKSRIVGGAQIAAHDQEHAVYWQSDAPVPTYDLEAADLFFAATPAFVDLTQESNRRRLLSAAGGAQFLGLDGSVAFGFKPAVFLSVTGGGLSSTANTFAANQGGGGAFSIANGPLVLAATAPAGVEAATPPGPNIVGDYRNGALYSYNLDQPLDAGAQRRWLRTWRALIRPDPKPHRFDRLTIVLETGSGVPDGTDPQLVMRWSDDGGHTWSNRRLVAAGQTGQTSRRVFFTRLGTTRRASGLDRIFELSCSDVFKVAIVSAEVEP